MSGAADAGFLSSIQSSGVATTIAQSTVITGLLSGVHLVGLALIVGAVMVSALRLLRLLLPEYAVADVTSATRPAIGIGIVLSITSGLLLVAPRATIAPKNTIFQTKMALLLAAVAFHLTIYRQATGRGAMPFFPLRLTAGIGLALWFGVVLAGCAFILLE